MHISKNGDMLSLISDGCGGLLAASVNAKVFHIMCAHGVSAGSPWRVSSACRLHTHDVYSLVLFSKNTVLSGGLDCQLAVYALERGARSFRAVRKVMPLPRHGSVTSSTSGRHNVLAQISGSGNLDVFRGDIEIGSDAAYMLHDAGVGLGFELAVRVEPPKVQPAPSSPASLASLRISNADSCRIWRGNWLRYQGTVNTWLCLAPAASLCFPVT
jgi:hypothetical protein